MIYDPDSMKIKLCKACKGLGSIILKTGKHIGCDECSGTGRLVVKTLKEMIEFDVVNDKITFDEDTMKVKVCKECLGLGELPNGLKCRECNGTGRWIEQAITTDYQLHHLDDIE